MDMPVVPDATSPIPNLKQPANIITIHHPASNIFERLPSFLHNRSCHCCCPKRQFQPMRVQLPPKNREQIVIKWHRRANQLNEGS